MKHITTNVASHSRSLIENVDSTLTLWNVSTVSFFGAKIVNVHDVKFLGVHIDDLLTWKNELASIESSISSACYVLRSLRDLVDRRHLKVVYHTLIESKLRYSVKLWGNSYDYNMHKAFVIRKRVM
jgi:hypothetical protein